MSSVKELLVNELCSSISKKQVVDACTLSRPSDRLYGFIDALTTSAGKCLRYSDTASMVFVFDGKIWIPLTSSMGTEYNTLVNSSCREVLLRCCKGIQRGDLLSGENRIGKSVLDGAIQNKMEESPVCIGFQNGVWDFSNPLSPEAHSFEERLPITSIRPYSYDPSARCPRWETFIENALSTSDADTLQCFFGLGVKPRTMLGHSVEKMLWLIGNGGNGKSTCLDVLEYVYGEGLFSHASLPTLLDSNVISRMLGTAPIVGCRYNRCDEIQFSDISKKIDLLKRLCSADHVEYRRIKGNASSSNEIPFFVFSMNRMPKSGNTDPALLRRLLIVRFGFTVSADRMDTGLRETLCGEAPGIWNWCVEGYKRMCERGFLFPRNKDNEDEQRRFMLDGGQMLEVWLQDEGIYPQSTKRLQQPYKVPLTILWERYNEWCEKGGLECDFTTIKEFSKIMTNGTRWRAGMGYKKKRYSGGMYLEVFSDKKLSYGII